ncbi:SDR family oxidoreductase [Flammeovirga kamogawensis]|uniref:SDR family oxidoreductase n=2 Tax=Flammeovirga kamogawensis TaxID=373891 RepID=A0ABX8H0E7_9BACT|nr:SDR family oxidoreductase [Flammeovirga kamogawensis]QWG09138.1 SDR family oxidoreductase [Flammeovirga kamogawensis]TRX69653.1 SDR family oxidoreductase [Flammeovirga kamogawensis]
MSKMIVVTGGSKGIGRAIINKFAGIGKNVVVCARKLADLESLKCEVEEVYNVTVHIFQADVSNKEECLSFINYVNGLDEDIEILVNNAGVFVPGSIHNEDEGAFEMMMQTNMYSTYYITRGLINKMIEKKEGYIFNIASVASFVAYANGGSYAISKHAMLGFSRSLREEMKPYNVKVTSVMPGATYTNSWAGVDLPEERFIKSQDIADLVFSAYNLSNSAVVEDIIVRPQLGDI